MLWLVWKGDQGNCILPPQKKQRSLEELLEVLILSTAASLHGRRA